jgi:hypothetical protein
MPHLVLGQPVPCYRGLKSDYHRHELGEILVSLGPRSHDFFAGFCGKPGPKEQSFALSLASRQAMISALFGKQNGAV